MSMPIAFRRLAGRPILFSGVVLAIAIASAVVTALGSVVDGLLYRPLPFRESAQLVVIDYRRDGARPPEISYLPRLAPERAELRDRLASSSIVTATSQVGFATFFDVTETRALGIDVTGVDAQFFPLLGVAPAAGRTFTRADERAPAALSRQSPLPLPIVVSERLARRFFGGAAGALGSHALAGRSVNVIGVMPPGFKFPGETDVWAPVAADRDRLPGYARLAPGTSVAQLSSAFPLLAAERLRDAVRPAERGGITLLFAAALLLLVVTWVQVAALTLTDAIAQGREIGVRLALGATRGSLLRLFASQSAILAIAALCLSCLAVRPLTNVLIAGLPEDLRHGQYLAVDWRTFAFCTVLAAIECMVLTAVPAVTAWRSWSVRLLAGGLGVSHARAGRARTALLVAQLAATGFLLYTSALMLRSVIAATTFDYGADIRHVVSFSSPPWARLGATSPELDAAFREHGARMVESAEALEMTPDVIAAATFFSAPLGLGVQEAPNSATARLSHVDGTNLEIRTNSVGRDFVRAFGATLVAGHSFDAPEETRSQHSAVANVSLARELLAGPGVMGEREPQAVVGMPIVIPYFNGRIIGVIKDFVDMDLKRAPDPQLFTLDPDGMASAGLAIRVQGPLELALPRVQLTLARIWGTGQGQLTPLTGPLDKITAPYRAEAALLGVIAGCCVPIAAVGLIGALCETVRLRTRDIAIRLALGAEPGAIRRMVVTQAMAVALAGVAVGGVAGVVAGKASAHLLFHVPPADVVSLLAVVTGVLALAWSATWLPVRRALAVQPTEALRDV